jgi:uncharacterized protein YecE (DUF72 family)
MSGLKVHVGKAALVGHIERYAQKFDFLELRADPSLLAAKRLRRLREGVPEHFSFSVVAPRELALLDRATPDKAFLDAARAVAEALKARFLLLRTPATVAPSQRSRGRISTLVDALRGAAKDVAWEPRGIWTDDEAEAFAQELGVTLVRDLAEQDAPAGNVVYTRLLALGRNTRMGSGAVERVAERIADAEEAFVIVEGDGAVGVARRLREARDEDDDDDDPSAVRLVRSAAFGGGVAAAGVTHADDLVEAIDGEDAEAEGEAEEEGDDDELDDDELDEDDEDFDDEDE